MIDAAGDVARCTLVLGPRRCGKSEAAEWALASFPHLLYVATLWSDAGSAETIARHQLRRGPGWRLLEVSGRLEDDARALSSAVAEMDRPAAVLVDGLTTWAIRAAGTPARLPETARQLGAVLVFCAHRFSDVTWCWVDAVEVPLTPVEHTMAASSSAMWDALRAGVPDLLVETWTSEGRRNGNVSGDVGG